MVLPQSILQTNSKLFFINNQNAPPPALPMETIKVIGTSYRQMAPTNVSTTILNYGNSNDSV
jgi:hypothetical protein